MFLVLSVSAET